MSPKFSERHRKILEFLASYSAEHADFPPLRQVGQSIGVKSTSLVVYYLNQLEEMGYIKRGAGLERSVHNFPAQVFTEVVRIPLRGYLRADQLIP